MSSYYASISRNPAYARLFSGSMWNLSGRIFNRGSTFIVNIIVARMLGKLVFGEYSIIVTTLTTAVALLQVGMGQTAAKYIAEMRTSNPRRAGHILGLCTMTSWVMSLAGSLLLVVLSPLMARHLLQAEHLTRPLMIGAGFLLFSSFNGFQLGALEGLESFRSITEAGFVSGMATIALISAGAKLWGLQGALYGLAASAVVKYIAHNIWLRRSMRHQGLSLSFGSFWHERLIILHFAIPTTLNSYFSLPILWLAGALLVRSPGGFGEMAMYSAATSIRVMVLFLPKVINNVSRSILNNMYGLGDRALFLKTLKNNSILIVLSNTLLAGFVFLFGRMILGLFGRDFMSADTVLGVLLLSTVAESATLSFFQIIITHGKMWRSFFLLNVPRESLFLLLTVYLVPSHGALGVATAYLVSQVAGTILTVILAFGIVNDTSNMRDSDTNCFMS